jgi:hypothetical protein
MPDHRDDTNLFVEVDGANVYGTKSAKDGVGGRCAAVAASTVPNPLTGVGSSGSWRQRVHHGR